MSKRKKQKLKGRKWGKKRGCRKKRMQRTERRGGLKSKERKDALIPWFHRDWF